MCPEGIYFSEYHWREPQMLWTYRFYPDGVLLFAYSGIKASLTVHTASGSSVLHPKDIIDTKTMLPTFSGCFSRESEKRLTSRGGFPAMIRSTWEADGMTLSFRHPYVGGEECLLSGACSEDRLALTMTGRRITVYGELKIFPPRSLVFTRLSEPPHGTHALTRSN